MIMTAFPETHGASEARFFFIMACVMGTVAISGFALMAFLGVSSFARPWFYHAHAAVFISWTLLYVAQNSLILMGNIPLHRRMGLGATVLIPLLIAFGIGLTFMSLRVTGGPPFFRQAEFLVVNILHIGAFALLAIWALRRRRDTDWHRRLMFGAMATVGGPGLARLLPLPMTIPYTFYVVFLAAMIFPIIGMIADNRIRGSVHPAWRWTLIIPLVAVLAGEALSTLPAIENWTADWVAGTPGGERPAGPFMPPGM